jgi:uncharacterized Tic20 family protein
MRQPELGYKVLERRQHRNLTQEQLAEMCEVSTRTIQRIESGEVDPRAYTLQCLSTALEYDFSSEDTTRENLWLALIHISSIFCIPIIPLLLWSWKKEGSLKIDRQGRLVLNFQITMMLTLFAAAILLVIIPVALVVLMESGTPFLQTDTVFIPLVLCATIPLFLTAIFCTYQGLVNALRALSDKPVRYPLSIPFVK